MVRWIGLAAIVLVLVGCGALPNDAGSSARNSAAFVTSSCPFSVNGPSVYSGGVRCGYLLVPENRQVAGSRRIKLAVAVFKAPRPSPAPDPLIYLVGGPGAAIVASLGSRIVTSGMPAYVGNRDFILIDQRGAGLSVPALDCPEVDNANYTVLEQHLSDGAALREEFDALRACRSRLVHEGVDLSAYNTEENAADIAALGPALGYRLVNVYGGSYGSSLALQVMRDHPQNIRSVVMDAITTPAFNQFNDSIPNTWRALQAMVRSCAASTVCNGAYPYLDRTLVRVLLRLKAHPAMLRLYSSQRNRYYRVPMNDTSFGAFLQEAVAAPGTLGQVPGLIRDMDINYYRAIEQLEQESGWGAPSQSARGMYLSMECSSDQATATRASIAGRAAALPAALRNDFVAYNAQYLQACAIWHVPSLPSIDRTFFHSTIPTLLLSGTYDPKTSPGQARRLLPYFRYSYLLQFPDMAHGVVGVTPCSDQVVHSFLTAPLQHPASGCVRNLSVTWF